MSWNRPMSSPKGHIPIRTCISCGKRQKKQDMLRLVVDETGLLGPDPERTQPGRGRYVCPEIECIAALRECRRPKAFLRPFRVENGLLEQLKSLSLR